MNHRSVTAAGARARDTRACGTQAPATHSGDTRACGSKIRGTHPRRVPGSHRPALSAVAALLLTLSLLSTLLLTGCAQPPELGEVRDRFVELIDASAEVNALLWGEGLPYYAEDDPYAVENHLYDDVSKNLGPYRYVQLDAKYHSVEQIRRAAETVYSRAYLDDVGSPLFEGAVLEDGTVLYARYYDDSAGLCISTQSENLLPGRRVYDYDTMEIVKKLSSDKIVTIRIDSSLEDGTLREVVKLRFVLEDGRWMLDSPSY